MSNLRKNDYIPLIWSGTSLLRPYPVIRKARGLAITEFAAVLSILLPLLLLILYVGFQASLAWTIRTNLDIAARKASREMAVSYGKDPLIVTDNTKQQSVFTKVRIPNFVNSNAQFEAPNFNVPARSVTIKVNYPGNGSYGLPRFPNPDVMNLGSNFTLSSTNTSALE
jgi:hypothetical protein